MSTKGRFQLERIATKFDDGVKECLQYLPTFGIGKTKAFHKLSQSTEMERLF